MKNDHILKSKFAMIYVSDLLWLGENIIPIIEKLENNEISQRNINNRQEI